jgi:drug/metabolite transporter (DMT)-like permease
MLVRSGSGVFSVEFLSAVRLVIASLVFFGVRALHHGPLTFHLRKKQLPWLLVAATGLFLNYWLYGLGLRYTSAGATAVISQIHTVATVLLAAALLDERLTATKVVGMGVATAGVFLVIFQGVNLRDFFGAGHLYGNLLEVGAAMAWPLYAIGQTKAMHHARGQEVLTSIFSFAAVMMLLLLPFTGHAILQPPSMQDWGALLFLGLGSTAAAYWCFALAMQRIETSEGAVFSALSPPVAILLSFLLLNEPITTGAIVGVIFVVMGLVLTVWRRLPGGLRRERSVMILRHAHAQQGDR